MKRYIRAKINFDNLDSTARQSTSRHLGKLMDEQENLADEDYIESSVRFLQQQTYKAAGVQIQLLNDAITSLNSDIEFAYNKYGLQTCGLGDHIETALSDIDVEFEGGSALIWGDDPVNGGYVEFSVNNYGSSVGVVYISMCKDDEGCNTISLEQPDVNLKDWCNWLIDEYCDDFGNPTDIKSTDDAVYAIIDTIENQMGLIISYIEKAVEAGISNCIKQHPPKLN